MESCCQGVAVMWVSLDSHCVVGLLAQSCCELLWGADGEELLLGSCCEELWGADDEELLLGSCL